MNRGFRFAVIFGAYGFWLPNDLRGSWSCLVGSWELGRFGRATKTDEWCSLAARAHNHGARLAAKCALEYPPVQFSGVQARAVGNGFAKYVAKADLTVWACSILPEHVHLVLARHHYSVEQITNHPKGAATRQLVRKQLHPLASYAAGGGRLPKAWERGEWKVLLNSEIDITRAIRYVERNPVREGSGPRNGRSYDHMR